MIRMIVLMKRKDGITKEEYRDHYENSHSQLAKKFFGNNMHNYTRMYLTDDPDAVREGKICPFDSVTCTDFADWDAIREFSRVYELPHVKKIMNEDEEKFVDMKNSYAVLAEICKTSDEEARRSYEPQD